MSPNEMSLWEAIDQLRAADARYAREAYGFVLAALGATVQTLSEERLADPERRHLSGGELLLGVVKLARQEFGPLAPTVFQEWHLEASEDVGHIVFQLVGCGQLSARPEDTLDDFRLGPDLIAALSAPDDTFARAPIRQRNARPDRGEPGTPA